MADQFEALNISKIAPIKTLELPKLKPIETDSVPKRQSLSEWAMAGGGVPASHKGRADVWHEKARKMAEGGAVYNTVPDMSDGGQIIDGPAFAEGGAAFGVHPHMRSKRSKQDPEAAKNAPVDLVRGAISGVLGAPGDIESLARLPYELITGNESPTILPTSESIEKRLPFGSDTPVSRAASGLGQLGGGFYTGPGAPIRAVGALPGAIKHGAEEFAKASAAGAPHMVSPVRSMGEAAEPLTRTERLEKLAETERALPLRLSRAPAKAQGEIAAHAERVGRQMLGEHVGSGKKGDTTNLAGRSRKENERIKGIEYELQSTKDLPTSQAYEPRIGDVNVALPGDYTVSDVNLKSVQGTPVGSKQEGGSRYGLGKLDMEDPLFWASNEGPAQLVQDKITDVAHIYEPERVLAHHLAMGPVATNFAQHFADANLRAIDFSKLSKKDMDLFDSIIAGGYDIKNPKTGQKESITFPHWPGIADPEAAYEVMRRDPELRKWFNSRMKTPSVTEATNMPNGLDIQWAITHPELRNMEVNLTGHSVGEMVPGAQLTGTADHQTYGKGIRGTYLGHQKELTPFVLSFPDAAQHIMSTKRPQDFTGTIQKVFPHQVVDQQYIDELGEYERQLQKVLLGKKKGGPARSGLSVLEHTRA